MNSNRRTAALLLAAAMTVSLAACGNGANQDPTAAIQAALEKIDAVESMDAVMFMEMDMSVMGQSIEADTTMNMSCFNDPVKLKADMTMNMGAMGSVSMSIYAQQDGEMCSTYLYDGTGWTVETMDLGDLQQYDAQESMSLYLECGEDFTLAGSEKINGSTADKYTGVIRGEALEKVLASSAATQSVESISGELDLADLYSDLGDLPITVCVDRETGYPVRYYLVMTKMMQSILEKTMAAAVESGEANLSGMMTVDQLTITMDCYNFGNATEFTIPQEALEAAQGGGSAVDDPLSADNSLGSSYRLTWMEMDGDRYDIDTLSALSDEEFLITLNLLDDGVFQLDMYTDGVSETVEGTWTLDGTDLTLTSEGEELAGELIGTSLTLTQDGETMGFELAQD